MRWLAIVAVALLLSGCVLPTNSPTSPPPSPAPAPAPAPTPSALDTASDFCKVQHTETRPEGPIAVCNVLYDEPPLVHLPSATGNRAFAGMEDGHFVTIAGSQFPVARENQTVEAGKRAAVTLYEVTLRADAVASYQPVLEFNQSLFVAPLQGVVAEGLISATNDDGSFNRTPTLPVRVAFGSHVAFDPSVNASDVVGTIENLDRAVNSSEGVCIPALSSYGDASPFLGGATVALPAYRVPTMHFFGDDKFVVEYVQNGTSIGSEMGRAWYRGPIDLFRGTLAIGSYEGSPHGSPGSIPKMDLHPVTEGGGACAPPLAGAGASRPPPAPIGNFTITEFRGWPNDFFPGYATQYAAQGDVQFNSYDGHDAPIFWSSKDACWKDNVCMVNKTYPCRLDPGGSFSGKLYAWLYGEAMPNNPGFAQFKLQCNMNVSVWFSGSYDKGYQINFKATPYAQP